MKFHLPSTITLPYNTAFYITDIAIPVLWYTVEAEKNYSIYFKINGPDYAPSKHNSTERKFSTTTVAAALCGVMNALYPSCTPTGTTPQRCAPQANLVNNNIIKANIVESFEI